MSKYAEIDAAIIEAIKAGHGTMERITSGKLGVWKMASALATDCETFRIIDRRLQALRKAGAISYANKAWKAAA